MLNSYLSTRTAADIDTRVSKILKDLGNPAPPLRLELVRELLKLDRQYYRSNKDGVVQEMAHRLTVVGKQVLKRPMILWDAIRKFDLKALYLPDRKRILLNGDLPTAKQRWNEAHETIHSVIPWHDHLMFGDNEHSVSPMCHAQIETEANYGAGRLIFLQDQFIEQIRGADLNLAQIRQTAKVFGNTITSTLWRSVEQMTEPGLGMISPHPHHPKKDFDCEHPCRYLIRSPVFEKRFQTVNEKHLFGVISAYCSYTNRGPLGETETVLTDAAGIDHVFTFESFSNTYEVLTLAKYLRVRKKVLIVN